MCFVLLCARYALESIVTVCTRWIGYIVEVQAHIVHIVHIVPVCVIYAYIGIWVGVVALVHACYARDGARKNNSFFYNPIYLSKNNYS